MSDHVTDLWTGEPRCAGGCASPAAIARAKGRAPRVRGESEFAWQVVYQRCARCSGYVCAECGRIPVMSAGLMCDPCGARYVADQEGGPFGGS